VRCSKYYGSVRGVVIAVDTSGPATALTSVTPRRLHDLPAHRRAAANMNTVLRSQPVASTSQSSSQSTHCSVCLMVICDIAIIPCEHCLCCTCFQKYRTPLQPLQDVHVVLYAELIFPTPYVFISRRNTNDACSRFTRIYPTVL